MSYIYEWVTNIILIILLATILELLLPASSFQKYVKVVIGLLLIIAILNPVIKMFSLDLKSELASFTLHNGTIDDEEMKNLIENKKSEIQASLDAYKLEQMAVQLSKMVEGKLEDRFEKRLKDVVVKEQPGDGSEDSRWVVHVILESNQDPQSVEAVKEVVIDTEEQTDKPQEEKSDLHQVKQFLSDEWEIPSDQIVLVEEGGS